MKTTLIVAAIALVVGGGIGSGATLRITKAVKPEIKLECPQPVCPAFKCPEGNYIDFEKVKNFRGTLKIDQHYHIQANGDSLLLEKIIKEMEVKLSQLKLARCR
jgi:hypothetical protein